jgi:hypothetical protein
MREYQCEFVKVQETLKTEKAVGSYELHRCDSNHLLFSFCRYSLASAPFTVDNLFGWLIVYSVMKSTSRSIAARVLSWQGM